MYNVGETCELKNYVDENGKPTKVYFIKRNISKIKVKLLTKAKKKRRVGYYALGTEWNIYEDELKDKDEDVVVHNTTYDRFTCKICYTNKIDYISRCGHCICHSCKIRLRKFVCPFCRISLRNNVFKINNN